MAAYLPEEGIVLAQIAVDSKENEMQTVADTIFQARRVQPGQQVNSNRRGNNTYQYKNDAACSASC